MQAPLFLVVQGDVSAILQEKSPNDFAPKLNQQIQQVWMYVHRDHSGLHLFALQPPPLAHIEFQFFLDLGMVVYVHQKYGQHLQSPQPQSLQWRHREQFLQPVEIKNVLSREFQF